MKREKAANILDGDSGPDPQGGGQSFWNASLSSGSFWNKEPGMTRRTLLQNASWAVAAAAVSPLGSMAAAVPVSPVMAKLSTYMSEAGSRALPDEVIEQTKIHTLDTIAAMVSGSELPPGRAAVKFATSYGGGRIATVAGTNLLCGAIEAAMVNGVLAHSDETDDTHSPSQSHPGCGVVPAALAAAEQFGIDGTRFLRCVALGYDIGPRVTMTLGALQYMDDEHRSTHSIAGVFGASAAAGCAASLDAKQMRWLLDYASQQCSGIAAWQRDTDHIEKGFVFAGMPARSGVTGALVVQSGWTGVDDILSGPDNFFMAFAPKADPAGLIDKLGRRYEVTRTSIKKWTVGSPIQASLDGLQLLIKKHNIEPDQVRKITTRVAAHEASIVNNREMPDICLQHMMAVMLIDKTASFKSAHDKARMQDPAILRERAKIELVPDDDLDRKLPQREAIVEVTLKDGSHFSEHVVAVRGTPDNPMTRDEIVAKSRDLMAPVLGEAKCASLIEKVFGLENVKDIRELRPLLQRS